MRILLAVLSTTVLATAVLAQQQPTVTPPVAPQGTIQAKGAIAECDRLIGYLEETRPPAAGVTVEQAAAWRQASNFDACRETLRRVTNAKPDSQGTQTAPPAPGAPPQAQARPTSPGAEAAAPQVVVQQVQPSVTVRQGQPEIIVRQAPPIITVQQPHPEIIVRMPEPDVNVAVVRPEVQVNMPQPVVQVVPPQAQPQINTDRQQPKVRFERMGEPRIVYQPAEGQPQIRFESAGQTGAQPSVAASAGAQPQASSEALSPRAAQAQLNGGPAGNTAMARAAVPLEPAQTGAVPGDTQILKVSQLEDMSVHNGQGEKLGDVERVLMGADGKAYIVISHGGFLGLGAKQVAVSADQLALRGDRLVAEMLSDEQVRAFPEFKESANFKEMDGDETAALRPMR